MANELLSWPLCNTSIPSVRELLCHLLVGWISMIRPPCGGYMQQLHNSSLAGRELYALWRFPLMGIKLGRFINARVSYETFRIYHISFYLSSPLYVSENGTLFILIRNMRASTINLNMKDRRRKAKWLLNAMGKLKYHSLWIHIETAEKEVQDTSCQGSGASPSSKSPPR